MFSVEISLVFQLLMLPFWHPVRMGFSIPILRVKNWKSKLFSSIIKKANGVKLTFLYVKIQKWLYVAQYYRFFSYWCYLFDSLLGRDCAYACHKWRTKKGDLSSIVKISTKQLPYNWTSPCKSSFKSDYFQPNVTMFLVADAFVLTLCSERTLHRYATS